MRRSESQSSDRRRKISYAIHQEPISRRRKHRVPQVVGLAFFLVLATVITVGLVFGIGPSDIDTNNSTSTKVGVPNDLVRGPEPETERRLPKPSYDRGGSSQRPRGQGPRDYGFREPCDEVKLDTTKPRVEEPKVEPTKKETCEGKEKKYRFATVNSNSKLCSDIGITTIARHHGTVVDAAIATLVCMGVVSPQSSGLGGGFFMLVYERAKRKIHALDARVAAPARSTRYMYEQKLDAAREGFLSVATPGSIHGLWEAHKKLGRVDWKELLAPSIKLASDGFPVSQQLHNAIKTNRFKVHKNPELKARYIDRRTGEPVPAGEVIDNAPLARTLTTLAQHGPEAFYNGSVTQDIILDLVNSGGSLSVDDLLNYRSKWRDPVHTTLRDDLDLHTMPLPGSGQLLALIVNILDGYYKNSSIDDISLAYHRTIEATKFAMARKLYLGDPDFIKTVDKMVVGLESAEYAEKIRKKITNVTHEAQYYGRGGGVKDGGTGVVIVRNSDGDVAVATSSIGASFGSGILGKYTGIVYNDGMADFDLPQTPPTFSVLLPDTNYIQALKRPLSSMSPTLVIEPSGDVVLALAAGGGTSGLSAQALTILRTLYLNQDLKTAIDSPFVHNNWQPPFTSYERAISNSIVTKLRRRGHVMSKSQSAAFVHAFLMKDNFIFSYADGRKGGCVDGY